MKHIYRMCFGEKLPICSAFVCYNVIPVGSATNENRPGSERLWITIRATHRSRLPALRVTISKRLYRGRFDLPKSNKVRVIAITPPARDALLSLPEREGPVFLSKAGGRLCAPLLSSYLREVQAAAADSASTGT